MKFRFLITALIISLTIFNTSAQNKQQKELETRKKALLVQIKEMSELRSKQAQTRKSVVSQIEEISEKIQAQTELIHITNQQANLLNDQIQNNQSQIASLQKELTQLRKEYASIIQQSYKHRSSNSQMLFLLSSESVTQGYKRIQYIKQYTEYRKKQSQQIQQKNQKLTQINDELVAQRQEKNKVLTENKSAKEQLLKEKQEQEILVASIKKKESEYEAEIKKKRLQANAIDKEIERLIRLAIEEANRKKAEAERKRKEAERLAAAKKSASKNTKTTSVSSSNKEEKNTTSFELTPEGKALASSFEANKGKHIWPVARGYKSQGFGTYSDPIYPQLKHNNSGVTIVTTANADARAVFDGEVSAIIAVPGGNKAVQVRHGNFISIYYNLTEVYVNKGQRVFSKSPLGKIFTDSEGKTEMKFFLYKNTTKLNPEYWIHKL